MTRRPPSSPLFPYPPLSRSHWPRRDGGRCRPATVASGTRTTARARRPDRKSTRLNSSHSQISYAVFCLKKKTNNPLTPQLASQDSHTHDETKDNCTTAVSAV